MGSVAVQARPRLSQCKFERIGYANVDGPRRSSRRRLNCFGCDAMSIIHRLLAEAATARIPRTLLHSGFGPAVPTQGPRPLVTELIAGIAQSSPDAIAIKSGRRSMTYPTLL